MHGDGSGHVVSLFSPYHSGFVADIKGMSRESETSKTETESTITSTWFLSLEGLDATAFS